MDHSIVFSSDYINRNRRRRQTDALLLQAISTAMVARWCNTERSQCRCCHRGTSHLVLPRRLPVQQSTQRWCNIYLLCWQFRWPGQCSGTIMRTSPNGGVSWLSSKPLNATIGWVLTPMLPIGHASAGLLRTFHREKELQLTNWPLITIGVWHIKLMRRS